MLDPRNGFKEYKENSMLSKFQGKVTRMVRKSNIYLVEHVLPANAKMHLGDDHCKDGNCWDRRKLTRAEGLSFLILPFLSNPVLF